MSFSMQDMTQPDPSTHPQPAAQPASSPQAAAPAQPNTVVQASPTSPQDPNSFSMNEMSPDVAQSQAQQEAAAKAEADKKNKEDISKHGLLHRTWDWVNQPIFDNVLPEGIKTADIIKAAAFEKMYGEAYIPGVNDFDTKAETHFGMKGGKMDKATEAKMQKGKIRQYLEDHTNGWSEVALNPEARRAGVAGAAKDTADMAAGFTSPLSLGTLGLGSEEVQGAKAVGKIAKVASPLVGTAFGLQGAYNAATGGYKMATEGATPENVQETLGGLGQAALGSTSAVHAGGDIADTLREKVRPVTKTVAGQDVPVRPDGFLSDVAAKSVEPSVLQEAAGKTAAAVQRGVGEVTKGAVGSGADTAVSDRDRFGIRAHADDLKQQSVPAFQELDRLSDGVFSDAQQDEARARGDFSIEGREKLDEARKMQEYIMDEHRDALAKSGYDVDEMKSNYRKQVALNDIATKFDQATRAKSGGGYEVNGEKLANQIDRLRRMPEGKNLFDKAGLTTDHVDALADLADTLRKEQVEPKFGGLTKLAAKALAIGSFGHGITGLAEALTGESMAEKIGSKLMTKMLGEAMTSEPAAQNMNAAIKGGPSSPAWDTFTDTLKRLWQEDQGEMETPGTGEMGQIGRKSLTPIPTETNPEFKLKPRENGDLEMTHPNGESQMVLHPEPDTRPGMEGKTQLRQTGISAVDHPGAGQEMMDEAATRLKGSEKYSRIVSDYPDRRSPDNERHWQRLADRGHDVQTEPSNDSFGDPWDAQWNLENTKLNAGDTGKNYFIPTAAGETPATGVNPENEISTRSISSGSEDKGTFNRVPNDRAAVTGWDAIEQAEHQKPGYMRDLLDKVLSYKDNGIKLTPEQMADPRAGLKAVVDHWADNLTWLHDKMPPELRAIAKQWYDSAHVMANDIATRYGTTRPKVAGAIAALSPQNPWDVNVGQAERIIKAYQTLQDHPWTPEMDQALSKKIADSLKGKKPQVEYAENLKKIRGKTFAELENPKDPDTANYNQALWTTMYEKAHGNPQTPTYAPDGTIRGYQTFNFGLLDGAAKALAIMKGDGSAQSIHDIIGDGHKIRNFYNNIESPNSEMGHATIDTHHVNADMLKPMSSKNDVEVKDNFGGSPSHKGTGQKGTYSLHHEALKQAAAARDILPREMQSITWEGIKTLMGDEKKTPELRKAVTEIWQQHQAGELTLNEARDKIVKAAGGFDKPGWAKEREANAQSNTSSNEGSEGATDTSELPVLGVRGESPSAAGAGGGGNVSTSVPTAGAGADWTKAVQNAGKVKAKGKGAKPAGRKGIL
jgi:hypothetical protein